MKFIVHSNIWISLAAVALMWATDVLTSDVMASVELSSPHLYSIVFFSTLLTYNWQRMLSMKKRQEHAISKLSNWIGGNLVSGIVASIFAVAVCAFNFFHLAQNQQAALVLLGLVSVVYALPLLPSPRGWIRLRDFGFTKPIVLGLTWGFVCTWLPLIMPSTQYLDFALPEQIEWLFILANCMVMIAICIPFDIKDIAFDSATMAYPTLPVWLGVRKALWLAMVFSIIGLVVFSSWALMVGLGGFVIIAAILCTIIECWFINKTNADSTEWYYVMVLDGLILLRAGLLVSSFFYTAFILRNI